MRIRARTAVFAAVALLAAVPAADANFGSQGTAGTSGTTNGVWLTNNSQFHVAKRVLSTKYANGISYALTSVYGPTDLTTYLYVEPDPCSDASYDVCVYDGYYGDNGLGGWNACAGTTTGAHPDQVCSVTWLRINQSFNPPANAVACHELGHSVGLRHTADTTSCMYAPPGGLTDTSSTTLTTHDRGHVNGAY